VTRSDQPTQSGTALSAALYRTGNRPRSDVVWNTTSSLLFAVQSYAMLWVVQVTSGNVDAGVFSFATAQAFLFWSIGCYGMRPFQASDVQRAFSFAEYVGTRVVTIAAMVFTCAGFLVVQALGHDLGRTKLLMILAVTGLRVVDAAEDVVIGHLQQRGYLFVGARAATIRAVVVLAVFSLAVVLRAGVVLALLASIVASVATLGMMVASALPRSFAAHDRVFDTRRILRLLLECLPLLASAVLAMYLTNAPKYAIEAASPDRDIVQAEFGFLLMPGYVITLVSAFIYRPLILPMARQWASHLHRALAGRVLRVGAAIVALTAVACAIGYPLGPPLLSWLFRTDLTSRGWQFTALLASGGLLALVALETVVLTIMRRQLLMSVVSAVVTVTALAVGGLVVGRWGLSGACALAVGIAAVQCVLLAAVMVAGVARAARRPA